VASSFVSLAKIFGLPTINGAHFDRAILHISSSFASTLQVSADDQVQQLGRFLASG
jgi:hypothetical protein